MRVASTCTSSRKKHQSRDFRERIFFPDDEDVEDDGKADETCGQIFDPDCDAEAAQSLTLSHIRTHLFLPKSHSLFSDRMAVHASLLTHAG